MGTGDDSMSDVNGGREMSVAELIARLERVENRNLSVLVEVGGREPDVIEWADDEHGSAGVTLS